MVHEERSIGLHHDADMGGQLAIRAAVLPGLGGEQEIALPGVRAISKWPQLQLLCGLRSETYCPRQTNTASVFWL